MHIRMIQYEKTRHDLWCSSWFRLMARWSHQHRPVSWFSGMSRRVCVCKNRCAFYILVKLDDLMSHKYITFYHLNVGVVMSQKTVLVHPWASLLPFDHLSSTQINMRLWFCVFTTCVWASLVSCLWEAPFSNILDPPARLIICGNCK